MQKINLFHSLSINMYAAVLIRDFIHNGLSMEKAFFITLFSGLSYYVFNIFYNYQEFYRDYQKNILFLQNKFSLNHKIFNENIKIPNKPRLVKKIENLKDKLEILDINNISSFSKKEIEYLVNFIQENNSSSNKRSILEYIKRK